ncbi:MAG: S8 family serine peptidase [Longimicrobiaceae bacterium]
MKRLLTLVAGVLVTAACQDQPDPVAPMESPELGPSLSVVVDPALTDAVAGATEGDLLEVIVNFDETLTTSSTIANTLQDVGAGVVTFEHLSMVAALTTPSQIATIQTLTGVQSIYLNSQLDYLLAESIETIRADEVWAAGYTGKDVGIAILDSGIDGLYHPDLKYPEKTVQNVKYVGDSRDLYSFGDDTPEPGFSLYVENVANSETSIGHGTHVAGIAAGTGEASSAGIYTGVAPDAGLIGIGAGDVLFIFWALAGFDYILEHQDEYNIQVVNNSWGSSGEFDPTGPINEATKEVHDAGITVVFAAGNAGPDQNTMNRYSVAPWVIGVAAGCKLVQDPTNSAVHCEDPNGRAPVLAGFSSRGIPGDDLYHPDVTAPGVHIVSARASTGAVLNGLDANHDAQICNISLQHVDYYTCASGTSMASPHVAGVVALLEEASGGAITPDEVLEVLTTTVRPLDGYDVWEVGAGYVDAFEAVKAASRGKYSK